MPDIPDETAAPVSVTLHPVEGGGILFNALTGRLFACNPAAALSWLGIASGEDEDAATLSLVDSFGITPSEARRWFRTSRDTFVTLDLLPRRAGPRPPSGPIATLPSTELRGSVFSLFDRLFAIDAPPAVHAHLGALLRNCRSEAPRAGTLTGTLQITVAPLGSRWGFALDGGDPTPCDLDEIAALVECHVIQTIVPAVPHDLCLHAAGLDNGRHRLVLAGPSGSGKTTLSIALARAGWRLGSDEMILLTEGGRMRPLPLPPCVKAEAFPVIEGWFPALRDEPLQKRYGRTVKYLPAGSGELSSAATIVVFPRYDSGAQPAAEDMAPIDGLSALLAQCVYVPPGFRVAQVGKLVRWHKDTRYIKMRYGTTEQALQLIDEIDEI